MTRESTLPKAEVETEERYSQSCASLSELNLALLDVMGSSAASRSPLLDFWTKHARDEYLSAAMLHDGTKALVQAEDSQTVRSVVPIVAITLDTTLFDCDEFSGHRTVSMLPLADSLASPVLYESMQECPETGRRGFAHPRELVLQLATVFRRRENGDNGPLRDFGVDPLTPGETWTRTPFFRSSHRLKNDCGEECSLAVGITHLRIPSDDFLLEESSELLIKGKLAYFPFLQAAIGSNPKRSCFRASLIGSMLVATVDWDTSPSECEPLVRFRVPYVAAVPYEAACRNLAQHWSAFDSLRERVKGLLNELEVGSEDASFSVSKGTVDDLEAELNQAEERLRRAVCSGDNLLREGHLAHAFVHIYRVHGLDTVAATDEGSVAKQAQAGESADGDSEVGSSASTCIAWRISLTGTGDHALLPPVWIAGPETRQ